MDQRLAHGRVGVEQIDVGLRGHMLSVYNYMGLALALTGLTAFVTATTPFLRELIFGPP
jgi:FtsH-binding integral membrane protein